MVLEIRTWKPETDTQTTQDKNIQRDSKRKLYFYDLLTLISLKTKNVPSITEYETLENVGQPLTLIVRTQNYWDISQMIFLQSRQ